MTHPGTGNPTWQDYPNTSTPVTAAALEAMEGVLDRAAGPVCESWLTTEYLNLPGNSYLGMRGQMEPPAGRDPFGMWAKPSGGDTMYDMTVPSGWAGRYEIDWQIFADRVAYNPVIAIVLLNAPPIQVNIAPYIAGRGVQPGMGYCRLSAVLSAGDRIALGVYVVQTGAWDMKTVLPGTTVRTKSVMRYVGPA